MCQTPVARFWALAFCAFAALSSLAEAQQTPTGLHDDTAGTIRDLALRKENLAFAQASADIIFDVDYVYRASTLMGEPILLCGARLTNPRGAVSFVDRGETHQVRVTPQDAELIDPHHVDLIARYELPNGQAFFARCSTGIPGTEWRDPHNLATSPSWDELLCTSGGFDGGFTVIAGLELGPKLDMLDRNWCGFRYLEEEEVKALFEGRGLQASTVYVGSLSLNVADLVLREIKERQAIRLADRLAEQIEMALDDTRPGMLAGGEANDGWRELNNWAQGRIEDANRHIDARERARAMRHAIRHLLGAEHSGDAPTTMLRALQEALAARLAAQTERNFAEDERNHAASMEEEWRRLSTDAEARLNAARSAIAAAPEFKFGVQGGPENIARVIRKFTMDDAVHDAVIAKDGRYFFYVTDYNIIKINTENGSRKSIKYIVFGGELDFFLSPNDNYLVSQDIYFEPFIIDSETGENSRKFDVQGTTQASRSRFVGFTADGQHALSRHVNEVILWDAASGAEIRRFGANSGDGRIFSAALSPDGRHILTVGGGNIRLWDVATGAEVRHGAIEHVGRLGFTGDGRHAFVATGDNVEVWDMTTWRVVQHLPGIAAAPVSDGRFLLTLSENHISLWEPSSGEEIRRLTLPGPQISSPNRRRVAVSPDGRFAITWARGYDLPVVLWGPEE